MMDTENKWFNWRLIHILQHATIIHENIGSFSYSLLSRQFAMVAIQSIWAILLFIPHLLGLSSHILKKKISFQ